MNTGNRATSCFEFIFDNLSDTLIKLKLNNSDVSQSKIQRIQSKQAEVPGPVLTHSDKHKSPRPLSRAKLITEFAHRSLHLNEKPVFDEQLQRDRKPSVETHSHDLDSKEKSKSPQIVRFSHKNARIVENALANMINRVSVQSNDISNEDVLNLKKGNRSEKQNPT
ncbi:hypothetical protein RF11_11061 [Thelohanellus kitauei]|uniref:Uncharacterized protein n=1 Tax=Thelohanellus kitauei TaxID=669202 RepID=A0A0C2N656_THEKT|nr:hypothetical protein RF11_11061 [Thelohanellus kitauei]